jgi:hypothetical protein
MMTTEDIEIAQMMAKAWKMNDERNKRIEIEKKSMQLLDDIAEMSAEENDT